MNKKYLYRFLLILITSTICNISIAASYYVSATGSDANNGLSSTTPWQTISKVNSMMSTFVAGDQILFKRGDKFYGTLTPSKSGLAGNQIIFGAYGSGNLPIITGKKAITGWSVHSGSIYKANFTDSLTNLFVSNKLMTIARYPNTGFLKIDAGTGNTGFLDAELTQGSNYFKDATCKIRTINWQYETPLVLASSPGSITFDTNTQYPPAAGFGYYIDNKLNLLDVEGEWFYDRPGGIVYLYAPGGVHPNTLTVEGIVLNHGISIANSRHYFKIQDINVTGYKSQGIEVPSNHDITILRCVINYAGKIGIRINGTSNIIQDNILEDNFNVALSGVITNGLIKGNTINRTGIIPGYGNNGWGCYAVQVFTGTNTVSEYNVVDSTGYSGMRVVGNMTLRNNIISYSCLTLNDGGGIDLNDADGLQILNNIVTFTIGDIVSAASPVRYANGIYFGPGVTKNILIQNNTVASNSNVGINVNNNSTTTNNRFLNNVMYNNGYSQILFADFNSTSYSPSYNNIVKGNIFYGLSVSQLCMEHQMWRSPNFSDYGNFDSNYYCNPYTEAVFRRTMVYGGYTSRYLRLPTWKSEFNEDLTSKYSQFSFDQYKVTDTLSNNLITNSRFTTNIVPWTTTPSPGSQISHSTNPVLDTGCMRNTWNGIGSYESMTSSNYVNIVKGNYYFLSLSCAGNKSGDFNTFGRPVVGGNPFIYPRRYLGFETYRRDYSFVFRADTNDASMRVAINLWMPDSLVYIDNVYLYEVSTQRIDSTVTNKLFTNTTIAAQVVSLGGITYKDLDGSLVTGSITLQPYSSRILINDYTTGLQSNLQLTALRQGFYNAPSNSMIQDTFKVYLRNTSSPYLIKDSAKAIVNSSGLGSYNFTKAVNGTDYFIVLKHRNSIETWSSTAINFSDNQASYDFTTSESQAYGNNMIKIDNTPLRYGIYGGDVNQDGQVDNIDLGRIDTDSYNLETGYLPTDLSGDEIVDAIDLLIVDNNSFNFVRRLRP